MAEIKYNQTKEAVRSSYEDAWRALRGIKMYGSMFAIARATPSTTAVQMDTIVKALAASRESFERELGLLTDHLAELSKLDSIKYHTDIYYDGATGLPKSIEIV